MRHLPHTLGSAVDGSGLRDRLAWLDESLRRRGFDSVDAARLHATLPSDLVELALARTDCSTHEAPARRVRWGAAVCSLFESALLHFPDNVLWDLDALVASLADAACAEGEAELERRVAQLLRLFAAYGAHGPIRFRYLHDFTFGYDWIKWVRRDEATRAGVTPFAAPLLDHLERRAQELHSAIDRDDAQYPRLRDERARNPFPFSREPEQERALLRALAAEGALPLRPDAPDDARRLPDVSRDFAALRVARAAALQG